MPAERRGPSSGKPRSSCTQCRQRKQRVGTLFREKPRQDFGRNNKLAESVTEYGLAITVRGVPSAISANLTLENDQGKPGLLRIITSSELWTYLPDEGPMRLKACPASLTSRTQPLMKRP